MVILQGLHGLLQFNIESEVLNHVDVVDEVDMSLML
jgi:hypothetical protein